MASEGSGPPQSQVKRFSHTIDSRPVSVSTIIAPTPTNDSGGRKRLRDNTDDTTAVNVKKVRCKMSSGDISMGGTSSDDVICIDSDSDCSIDQPQNQIGGIKTNAKFCGEHQHTEVNVDPSTQFATLEGSSTVAQSSPLVRCSLLSISKEQKSLALTQASLTNQQYVARTQLVHAESRQKGSTRTPIKADMREGRRTPPTKKKCSESIQSSSEAVIVSENRFSNDSRCTNVSNSGNIHSRISLESDKTKTASQKRTRCNQCIPCRTPDCGKCLYCK